MGSGIPGYKEMFSNSCEELQQNKQLFACLMAIGLDGVPGSFIAQDGDKG